VLSVGLLGAFSVSVEGETVPDDAWRLRKAKTLVKWLALTPERKLHAEEAFAVLWPDQDPAAARNNLHQAIYAARRAFSVDAGDGARYLELNDNVISLCPSDPLQVDVVEFEAAAAAARERGDADSYRRALDGFAGELLPEDRYEDWAEPRRRAVQELRLGLGIELAELEAAEDPATAIARLRELLVAEPLHEPAHRALMRLYADGGRRQEALAQFQELKQRLRREFEDTPDEETRHLYATILRRDAPARVGPKPTAPAAATGFIGRERELGEASNLLGSTRLLTLSGAGGCGKTRLALELTRREEASYPDGAWVVELAALGNPDLIAPAVAQAMDTRLASDRPLEVALCDHIGDSETLLVLDNCEHLIDGVAHLVVALLAGCSRLTVLATSREPLRVPGEVSWRVPSLSLPPRDWTPDPAALTSAEAVHLFCVRAAEAAPGFELNADNATAVAALCHRLDGMPLALELAAARVGALSPTQLVDRLDQALDLLSSGSRTAITRQQTLRATLAWSFDLLEPDEQMLLRRLAVFAGSFSLAAVEEICSDEGQGGEVLALLGRLVDKSLVHAEQAGGEHRYRLLETVRHYAGEQLEAAGEREAFSCRHRDWYLELAERDPTAAGELTGSEWLRQLDPERDNLRAALSSALAEDPEAAVCMADALWRFWLMRGYLAEAYRWLTEALEAAPERSAARGRALLAASLIGLRRGVHERLHEFLAEAVAIFDERGEAAAKLDAAEVWAGYRAIVSPVLELEALLNEHEDLRAADVPPGRPEAWAAHTRGIAAWLRRDYGRAREQLQLAIGAARDLEGERRPVLWPLSYGMISLQSELGYPLSLQEETVIIARRVAGPCALAYMLVNLAAVERIEGRLAEAEGLLEESLARFTQLGDRHGEGYALNALGNLARQVGDSERGQERLQRSLALREETGDRRGTGITLGCLAVLLARAGDSGGARAAAERSRHWFSDDDDMIGLGAAELCLAAVALCEDDLATARARLQAASSIFGRIESMHQGAWALAVLAELDAEDGEPEEARLRLRRAEREFELLGGEEGLAYCRSLRG
jgi:predicted ATPase/DNA-binding SARP family transcriptional activator